MTVKLKYSHQITEKRLFNKVVVNQEMIICVDYDGESYDNVEVLVYENGKYMGEISKLLDDAEGQPLVTMLEAINWDEMYSDYMTKEELYLNDQA